MAMMVVLLILFGVEHDHGEEEDGDHDDHDEHDDHWSS